MRKFIAIALVLSLAAPLIACGGDAFTPPAGNTPGGDEPLDKTEEIIAEIMVNGEVIDAPPPSVDGANGVRLLPLQPIAEALGYSMDWDGETMSARVENIYIRIGKDFYTEEGSDPVEFGPAPQLIDNYVYVPIYFFGVVLKDCEAHIIGGQVVVNAK